MFLKNVIVGTAGHIDHGKTTLIKALTGRDTDRLKEEKERGISIELGFTWFDLPSGRRAGIVDVPGHEKFIKNMLAGVAGIDVVILVIAADEGVMPQTKEHLNILTLLQVKRGIIALTKKDMVDEEWLELVTEQVREEVQGTFLEEARIIPVSSTKGHGLEDLINEIDNIADSTEERKNEGIFRLPIDRVFTISGFGTIVTGTLISGSISEGDKIEILPQRIAARVRTVQVHEASVKTAYAGQRVALNIANVKVEEIERGNILSNPETMVSTMMLDARIEMLKDSERSIDNRDRLRLYHGTSEVMCRVVLLDRDELGPGENAFVQLRLEEQIACQKDDRFVIRTYSPMITIAGGTVLDSNPPKRKRFREEVIEELKIKEKGSPEDIVEQYISNQSTKYPERKDIIKMTGNMKESYFDSLIAQLVQKQRVVEFKLGDDNYILHNSFLKELESRISDTLEIFHKKSPLKIGISKEELKSKTMDNIKQKLADALFTYYSSNNIIKLENHYVSLKDFKIEFNKLQQQIKDYLVKKFCVNKFNPPKLADILAEKKYNENQLKMVFDALVEANAIIKAGEDIYFAQEAYDEAVQMVKNYIKEHKAIELGQFRDLLGTSRKYAMALLDYFDQMKITKRVEDKRILF